MRRSYLQIVLWIFGIGISLFIFWSALNGLDGSPSTSDHVVLTKELATESDTASEIKLTCCGAHRTGQCGYYIESKLETSRAEFRNEVKENISCYPSLRPKVLRWLEQIRSGKVSDTSIFSRVYVPQLCKERLIEPLAFGHLDPRLYCLQFDPKWAGALRKRRQLPQLSKDFILLPTGSDDVGTGRRLFFDLGASWYNGTPQNFFKDDINGWGSSGQWFLEEFEKRAIPFDHLFLWEMRINVSEYIASGLPQRYHHKLTFTEGSIQTGLESPIRTLQANCKVEDYCLLKVDFDTPNVEMQILDELLQDNATIALIDEFFWDPVGIPFLKHYHTIRRLRELGVCAHSWV